MKDTPYNPYKGLGARYLGGGRFSGTHPHYSPDGNRIVFAAIEGASSEIDVLHVNSRKRTRLTTSPYWELAPRFSPDGDSILFLTDRETMDGELWLMNADGTKPRKLSPGIRHCSDVIFVPKKEAYLLVSGQIGERKIYVKGDSDTSARLLSPSERDCYSPIVSANGHYVCFMAMKEHTATAELAVCPIGGQRPVFLPSSGDDIVVPLGFGNGNGAVYYLQRFDTTADIWRVSVNSPHVRERIAKVGHYGHSGYVISPSYGRIYYISDAEQEFVYDIYSVNMKGEASPKQLTDGGGYVSELSLSADERYLTFVWEVTPSETRGRGWICQMSVAGGHVEKLCKNY
jgi:Tol biopolymer transport system component